MNKLIYREIIKHINRSVMTKEIERCTMSTNEISIYATNPATKTSIQFSRYVPIYYTEKPHIHHSLGMQQSEGSGIVSCDRGHIFSEEERKALFELAEKRYEYFQAMPELERKLYYALMTSNNKSKGR